ncbi:DUF3857 domain-containing protein [Chitinophaga vietnamensis]|uniref:DUF3857 domain-containing protein n=1 Tax=Chitinophaga vietnamensis TaxID=2593957 RepID=UPI0011777418|nr:DUF3857 domain-containing protein [Chitinophaga vietnamensis]
MRLISVVFVACTFLCLTALNVFSQDSSKLKFGKVSKEEFNVQRVEKDTGAHAIVISEIGSSAFETTGGSLQLVFKVHRRLKIVDKNGYDYATIRIGLYKSDGREEEKLSNLKAAAYNLENGEIVETRMENKNVFSDAVSKNYNVKKFAIPAVKEGSIIEYSYTITSPYFQHLRPWTFQNDVPTLWSEYSVSLPEYFDYVQIGQGFEDFAVKTKTSSRTTFSFRDDSRGATGPSQTFTVTPNVTTYRWALRNVAPIRDENYITTIDNYVNKIEFQLASVNWPEQAPKPFMSTWPKLMEDLLKDEDFGSALDKNNGFLADAVDEAIKDAKTDKEKANKIYNWVRSNFTCTDHSSLWMKKSLKSLLHDKSGNEAEINLLLTAMLKRAKLDASPIILSTRDHGYVYPYYPLLSRFNYVIAGVNTGDEFISMDASHPLLGFGKLLGSAYNGDARIVNTDATPMVYSPDSLREQAFTSVVFHKIENGELYGEFQQRPTYLNSYGIRNTVKEKKKEEYFKTVEKNYNGDVELSDTEIEGLDDLESPVLVRYNFKYKIGEDDVLYLNPLFGEAYKHNIFKSMERKFPVEMNAVYDEVYSFNMQVPPGYVVDELPKPAVAKYNEDEGFFQYLIQQSDDRIQLRCRVKLAKAVFPPEEYPTLRQFFDLVVKKQAEQIVLKKKK